jgi:hypothetical protein
MKKVVKVFFVVVIVTGLFALGSMKVLDKGVEGRTASGSTIVGFSDDINKQFVDSGVAMLQNGNLVLRMGLGADSHLLAQINQRDKSYSHCGIVVIEHGYPFVYHAIGGEDNPDARLRRDSASFFFSPQNNTRIAIVHLDLTAQQLLVLDTVVHNYYRARPKFDLQFDLATDDKLYCSEFVYKAMNKATHQSYIGLTTAAGHRFVGIDDLFLNSHAQLTWQAKFR